MLTPEQMAAAFNEWMRRYTEQPDAYDAAFRTIGAFLQEMAEGREPSYGETCTAYLLNLSAELTAEAAAAAG